MDDQFGLRKRSPLVFHRRAADSATIRNSFDEPVARRADRGSSEIDTPQQIERIADRPSRVFETKIASRLQTRER
ncbi:MAG TPA: hypothetical protein VFB32_06005, partial [Rudaea sp.]|nr:hypothetical protein [Rudaea sp.]